MISSPISATQVVDVPIDLGCLVVPCKTLPNVLQAIVDKICVAAPDFTSLDFGACVTPGETLLETLQNMITAIPCTVEGGGGEPASNDMLLTGLTTCSSDSWSCASADACLTFTNECTPGVVTVEVVTQALINRIVAMGNVIKTQCTAISTLQSQVAVIQAQITSIQSTCCA